MNYYTYKTTNLLNDKYYIGVHSTLKDFDENYFGSGVALRNAINKYGKENFECKILKRHPSSDEAYRHEKNVVNEEVVNDNQSYNMNIGGHGGSCKGHIKTWGKIKQPRSNEVKRKLSIAQSGKKASIETRKKISDRLMGNQHAKGMTYSHNQKARDAISKANKGKVYSKETLKKMSDARKGKGVGSANGMSSPEHRKKVSLSKIGLRGLRGPNGERKLALPNSTKWSLLINEGYVPSHK